MWSIHREMCSCCRGPRASVARDIVEGVQELSAILVGTYQHFVHCFHRRRRGFHGSSEWLQDLLVESETHRVVPGFSRLDPVDREVLRHSEKVDPDSVQIRLRAGEHRYSLQWQSS